MTTRITPVFSAAHASRWGDMSGNERHPQRKRTRTSDEENTETNVDANDRPAAPRAMKPLPTHHRQHPTPHAHAPAKSITKEDISHVPIYQHRDLPPNSTRMAVKTYTWITLWFVLTAPVIFWDAGYCFMRPRSMIGGDLHWIWEPYGIYQNIDYVYGVKALKDGDGFPNAQSLLNLIETFMNLAYVYLAHVSGWAPAPIVGFAAVSMTLSKTMLYWAQEYYCGFCSVGHNSMSDLILYWIIPNGFWIVVPSLIFVKLGKDIVASLNVAERSVAKTASGKQQ